MPEPGKGPEVEVSVVMPCLNEEEAIGTCVRQAREALEALGVPGEVVVVDNGSTDRSRELAEAAGARVVQEPRRGYGSAYLRGVEAARGRYIIMADADGTYDMALIPRFLEKLREGYDFVNGSRVKGEIQPGAMPWLHRWIGVPILTGILNLASGARVSDAHCGMRAISREAFPRLKLHTTGMEFASEMIIQAARAKLSIAEVPIHYLTRRGRSKLRTFRDGWRHLRFLLLYSPTLLFILPGLFAFLVGMAVLLALVRGPISVPGFGLGIHYMVLGSLLTILGFQVVNLGLFAKIYSLTQGLTEEDRVVDRMFRYLNLERGLALGFLIFLVGLGWLAWVLVNWVSRGFIFREGDTFVYAALFGATLTLIGVQTAFSSFFFSLLGLGKR